MFLKLVNESKKLNNETFQKLTKTVETILEDQRIRYAESSLRKPVKEAAKTKLDPALRDAIESENGERIHGSKLTDVKKVDELEALEKSIKNNGGIPIPEGRLKQMLRLADFSGVLILIATIVIRLQEVWIDRLFASDGAPIFMLMILLPSCLSPIFQRLFSSIMLTHQQQYAIAALHALGIGCWWISFGEEWLENYAEWYSLYSWLITILPSAFSWYLWIGWHQRFKTGSKSS